MRGLRIAGKIVSKAILVLLALVLTFNVYNIFMRYVMDVPQPTVFGYSGAVVLSGSMEPAICVDDMVIIHKEANYEVQDIVMYEGESSFVTHRIVDVTESGFITRGDSNNADDPEILPEQIAGKVVAVVPGVGKVIYFFQTPMGMCLLVLAALAILMVPMVFREDK